MLGRHGEGQALLNVQKRGIECAAIDRRLLGRLVAAALPVYGSRGTQANTKSPRSTNYLCPRDWACLHRRGTDVAAIAAFGRVGELAPSLPHLGRIASALLELHNAMLDHTYPFAKRALRLELWASELPRLVDALARRGCRIPSCCCFIDGKLFKIRRATEGEDAAYNGWKRMHATKH